MNILSLFDGISCGQVALERVGIKINNYYASEIDKYAIQVTQKNYPDTIQLGDITKITNEDLDKLGKIDLVIGGTPCQDLSNYKYYRGEVTGLNGEKSGLFYDFIRILKHIKPKYFLLENVASMETKWKDLITDIIGIEPIMINSSLVCAAERKLLPLEYERLQTLPDNYTDGLSDSRRYTAIGNGWTVDVIAHILKNIK